MDGRVFYEVIRVQGDVVTPISHGYEEEPLQRLAALMNLQAPPGVRYEIRRVRMETRPFEVDEGR